MKRMLIILAVVVLAGSISYGQTQVLSRNAVGYVRLSADKGSFNLISHNFVNIDGGAVTVTNLLGDQVPASSTVYLWDRAIQQYVAINKYAFGWFPDTNQIDRGTGFWLQIPDTATSNSYDIYLMGEVPSTTNADSSVSGFNLFGYPYPVSTLFTNTDLAKSGVTGDTLYYWTTNQEYDAVNRYAFGWFPDDFVLEPGMGFWYSTATPANWDEGKPYTWPN